MKPLYEQYRPARWEDVVGQEPVIRKLNALRQRGLRGRAFWLAGPSGCGKTSIARLIAAEEADPFATIEIDAQELLFDRLRDLERICQFRPLGGGVNAFIVNEAYALTYQVIRRLQTLLEEHVQKNSLWIFTAMPAGQEHMKKLVAEAGAFLSRCIHLEMSGPDQLRQPFARRCREIAQAEGLDARPLADYLQLADRCGSNLREMLQRVDAGEMLESSPSG